MKKDQATRDALSQFITRSKTTGQGNPDITPIMLDDDGNEVEEQRGKIVPVSIKRIERNTERIDFRTTPTMYKQIKAAAKELGMSLNEFVGAVIKSYIENKD